MLNGASSTESIAACKAEYASIYEDFICQMEGKGISFASGGAHAIEAADLRQQLRSLGASLANGGASVSVGRLSPACAVCATCGSGRTFMLSMECHRSCYFCFNPNQVGYGTGRRADGSWRKEMGEYADRGVRLTHVALTGGEPLLHSEEAVEFFDTAHRLFPDAHLRLYTSGDLLDRRLLARLCDVGLDEIRFSIKLNDSSALRELVFDRMSSAVKTLPSVGVEMPVEPGSFASMVELLQEVDARGVDFVNLLELCYPFYNWEAFEERGYTIKNPPFDVLYQYGYAGGLPVDGSEIEALRLLVYTARMNLSTGVHYCSLANKHREQIYAMNSPFSKKFDDFEFSCEDYFLRTTKVYGRDVHEAATLLGRAHAPFSIDDRGGFLQCHPKYRYILDSANIATALSVCVVEERGGSRVLRELKLED